MIANRCLAKGEYWVVNQILAKQLHTASEEMLAYTTKLMDKLEEVCFRILWFCNAAPRRSTLAISLTALW